MAETLEESFVKPEFPVVGIGASAGGIEAVTELFQNLPSKTGLAYFYIQHLDPTHESNLAAILARQTEMLVVEAEHNMKIDPDRVYVIPPNKEISLVDGIISVSPRPARPYSHLPINHFLISLAERYKESAIGVILSGSATDGTIGLKAIKMEGGVTYAQDNTARFESMPKSAIAEGAVDLVLSPKEIAQELVRLGKQNKIYSNLLNDPQRQLILDEDENLKAILKIMLKSVGVDFSQYRMNTIKRRIVRRMMLYKLTSLEDYLQYIKENTRETSLLYQDLLINVTTFFRDADACEYLSKVLLPKILASKSSNDPIRVWIPACSTGQEAYSIAILIIEAMGENSINRPIQIFATDLSEGAINKARVGVYTKDELVEVSPRRLQKFFNKIDGSYRIIKSIRDLCIFASHNILKDPPFSRLDLISCCNLLIYLDVQLQRKVLATFHYSLLNDGYIILGKSETVGSSAFLFTPLDKKVKVYSKKKDMTSRVSFDMNLAHTDYEKISPDTPKPAAKMYSQEMDLEKAVDDLLLKNYTPASVVVTAELDIVQFRGEAGLYLEPAPGKASLNLVKMARAGLAFDLRNLVHKARKSGMPVRKSGFQIMQGDKPIRFMIEAVPLKVMKDEYFLVAFQEEVISQAGDASTNTKEKQVQKLETELMSLREDMRSIVESQEAANEELQSANEEVVSSNEELQSINEELETSKEEIESSNEELMTINQELQVRNEQLAEAQEYAKAIFSTIGESVIVLDRDLRVKFANPAFYRTFHVTEEETEGNLLYELGSKQWNLKELSQMLHAIFEQNKVFAGMEVSYSFPKIGEKVMRLNAEKLRGRGQQEQLVILAFEDITEFKVSKDGNKISRQGVISQNIAANIPAMIWATGFDKLCTYVNKEWLNFTGLSIEQSLGASWTQALHPDDVQNAAYIFNSSVANEDPFSMTARMRAANGVYKQVVIKGKPNVDEKGNLTGYLGTCMEI